MMTREVVPDEHDARLTMTMPSAESAGKVADRPLLVCLALPASREFAHELHEWLGSA
jgi:hypothetical protein